MARDYFVQCTKPKSDDDYNWEADPLNSLARTVHEDYEIIDTGVLNDQGEPIMARKRFDPIGYVRFKER